MYIGHPTAENEVKMTASLLADGIQCRRRMWLASNGFNTWAQQPIRRKSRTIQSLLRFNDQDEDFLEGWDFEVSLLTGDRLDAWFTTEAVAVEYKSGQPHAAHIYQIWYYYRSLRLFGVTGIQIQLWYPKEWEKEAVNLAEQFHYDWDQVLDNILTIKIDRPASGEWDQLERIISVLEGELGMNEIPPLDYKPGDPLCTECSYRDFCHIGRKINKQKKEKTKKL